MCPILSVLVFYGNKGRGKTNFIDPKRNKLYPLLGSSELGSIKEIRVDMRSEFLYMSPWKQVQVEISYHSLHGRKL